MTGSIWLSALILQTPSVDDEVSRSFLRQLYREARSVVRVHDIDGDSDSDNDSVSDSDSDISDVFDNWR